MSRASFSSYFLASTVLGASLFGLILAFSLPYFLPPQEYSLFALNLALTQLASSLGFEWLRATIVRHGDKRLEEAESMHRSIRTLYTFLIGVLLISAITLGLISFVVPTLTLPALFCATTAMQGLFDARSAWARANFDNIILSMAALLRPALGLIFVVSLSFLTRSGLWAILGLCLSYLVSIFIFRDKVSRALMPAKLDKRETLNLLRFGTMAAVGTNISLAIPAALRAIMVALFGLTGASGKIFALEVAQRIFATTGMAFNLLHLQALIRTIDNEPLTIAVHKARNSIALEAVLYAAMVTMIAAAIEPVAQLVAPYQYRADFAASFPMLSILLATLSLRQYGVDPLFLAFRKLRYIAIAPALTFAFFAMAYVAIMFDLIDIPDLIPALVAGAITGFFIPFLFTRGWLPGVLPLVTLVGAAVSARFAVMVTPNLMQYSPFFAIAAQSFISVVIYGLLVAVILFVYQCIQVENSIAMITRWDIARSTTNSEGDA